MTELQLLKHIISQGYGHNRVSLFNYIGNLTLTFRDSHLWKMDKLSLDIYYKEIRRINSKRYRKKYSLGCASENEMILKAQQGDIQAREYVIISNLRFVIAIARLYQNRGLLLNDLIGEGNIGLIKALEKYDTTSMLSFRTYARYYIVNCITTALRKYGTVVYRPSYFSANYTKVHNFIDGFQIENGEKPSCQDIAIALELEVESVENVYDDKQPDISLAELYEYLDDFDHYDNCVNSSTDSNLSSISNMDTDEEMNDESLSIDINESLKILQTREREIVRMKLGIGCKEYSNDEIANRFDLSKERIRQIYEKAIRKLRNRS